MRHLDLAMLCKQVYFPKGGFVPGGWHCEEYFECLDSGLAFGIYQHEKNNETVIAFRGTDVRRISTFFQNLYTIAFAILGYTPNTAALAEQIIRDKLEQHQKAILTRLYRVLRTFKTNRLCLTGHSLGGLIAGLIAGLMSDLLDDKCIIVTFDDTGYKRFLPQNMGLRAFTYCGRPNPINTLHTHYGEVRRYFVSHNSSNFLHNLQDNMKLFFSSIGEDLIQLLFLLLVLNAIYNSIFNQKLFTYSFFNTLNYLQISANSNSTTASFNFFSDLYNNIWIYLSSMIAIVSYKIWQKTISEPMKEHGIDTIINILTKGNGEPEEYAVMHTWPNRTQLAANLARGFFNSINPLRTPNCINYFFNTKESEVPGYKEIRRVISAYRR